MFLAKTKDKSLFVQSLYVILTITGIVALPFIVHLIPYSGEIPLGTYLLPMFIAPLVAAFYISPLGLILSTIIAPIINHALTGMPAIPLMYFLICEMIIYALFSSWIVSSGKTFPGFSTAAFLVAKFTVLIPKLLILVGTITIPSLMKNILDLKISISGLVILFMVERFLACQQTEHA